MINAEKLKAFLHLKHDKDIASLPQCQYAIYQKVLEKAKRGETIRLCLNRRPGSDTLKRLILERVYRDVKQFKVGQKLEVDNATYRFVHCSEEAIYDPVVTAKVFEDMKQYSIGVDVAEDKE